MRLGVTWTSFFNWVNESFTLLRNDARGTPVRKVSQGERTAGKQFNNNLGWQTCQQLPIRLYAEPPALAPAHRLELARLRLPRKETAGTDSWWTGRGSRQCDLDPSQ